MPIFCPRGDVLVWVERVIVLKIINVFIFLQLKQWYVVNKLNKLAFGALESVSPLLTAVSGDKENTQ